MTIRLNTPASGGTPADPITPSDGAQDISGDLSVTGQVTAADVDASQVTTTSITADLVTASGIVVNGDHGISEDMTVGGQFAASGVTTDLVTASGIAVNGQAGSTLNDVGDKSGAVVVDADDGNVIKMTVVGNITSITVNNALPGSTYVLMVDEDGSGGYSIAFGSDFIWGDASEPTWVTTPNAKNMASAIYDGSKFRAGGGAGLG